MTSLEILFESLQGYRNCIEYRDKAKSVDIQNDSCFLEFETIFVRGQMLKIESQLIPFNEKIVSPEKVSMKYDWTKCIVEKTVYGIEQPSSEVPLYIGLLEALHNVGVAGLAIPLLLLHAFEDDLPMFDEIYSDFELVSESGDLFKFAGTTRRGSAEIVVNRQSTAIEKIIVDSKITESDQSEDFQSSIDAANLYGHGSTKSIVTRLSNGFIQKSKEPIFQKVEVNYTQIQFIK